MPTPDLAAATPVPSSIKIGYLADTDGANAALAAGMHLGTDLAVRQINDSGGVNGHPIEVTYVDPHGDPAVADQLARRLIQAEQVDLLMGGALDAECEGLQQLAATQRVAYIATLGCATEEFASVSCNRYAFRFAPVGRQQLAPLVGFMVGTYGARWAMLYSETDYGQAQLRAYTAELGRRGGAIVVAIGLGQNETNLGPVLTQVPTDGSIDGLILNGLSPGDLTRVSLALGRFGIAPRVQVIGVSGRDVYGGSYPDPLLGAVNVQTYLEGQPPNNPDGEAYERAWRTAAARQPEWAGILGGIDRALAFQGYVPYSTLMAVRRAMVAARYTGRQDTEALIGALERVNLPLGPDAPGGALLMNPADHQGAQNVYVYRVANAQQEELLAATPADQLPRFSTCHV